MSEPASEVRVVMAAINRAWRENHPKEMQPFLHPDITMALPGFSATVAGRDVLLSSFAEFCSNARVLQYDETDEQAHVIGDTAIVSFRFTMLYERASYRERSTGRDIWVFQRQNGRWLAVWRTMIDLKDERQSL